jgi:hypothetical protein
MDKSTFLGSVSGGMGYLATLPLDAIKQNIQLGRTFSPTSMTQYFKGAWLGLFSIVPQMGIKFSVNSYMTTNYTFHPMVNGFIAGACDGAFLGPVLAAQSLQQINTTLNYQSAFAFLRSQSLFQLAIPMSARNAIYTSCLLGGYRMIPNKNQTVSQDLVYASMLNVPATILCSPADVIRAKQTEHLLQKKPIGVFHIMKEIQLKDGVKGFFRGYPMLYINFAIRFPFTLAIFNYLMRITS